MPTLRVSLHPIGGFCAVSHHLPLSQNTDAELSIHATTGFGMCANFGRTIHCVAAEPYATFVRFDVSDGRQELAYESAVLGRLRRGYRVLQLRGGHDGQGKMLGTRIEICYLFIRITVGSEHNLWAEPRHRVRQISDLQGLIAQQRDCIDEQRANLEEQRIHLERQRARIEELERTAHQADIGHQDGRQASPITVPTEQITAPTHSSILAHLEQSIVADHNEENDVADHNEENDDEYAQSRKASMLLRV